MGSGALEAPGGADFARRIDAHFRALPAEAIDAAVEVTRAEFRWICGNMPAAAESAGRALEFDPIATDEQVRALVVLALVDFRRDQFEEARARFAKLTRLRRDAGDWLHLGLCENRLENGEAAIRALEKSREIDPSSLAACTALVAIYNARHEFNLERRLNDEIVRLKRRSPSSEK
jgi:tetratricopeptide (TPR) repeat protein